MAVEIITTVTSPATATPPADPYDLTDLATVKDELKITDTASDAWLQRAITQASSAISNYCNRIFQQESIQDLCYIEQDPYPSQVPGGVYPLQLSRWPVSAVASVAQTIAAGTMATLTQDTDFKLDGRRGWLLRLNIFTGVTTRWEAMPVTVAYTAGFSAIPADIVDAVLRLITGRFRARDRDPMLKSFSEPSVGTETYWIGPPPGQSGALAPEIAALVDPYRVPVIA